MARENSNEHLFLEMYPSLRKVSFRRWRTNNLFMDKKVMTRVGACENRKKNWSVQCTCALSVSHCSSMIWQTLERKTCVCICVILHWNSNWLLCCDPLTRAKMFENSSHLLFYFLSHKVQPWLDVLGLEMLCFLHQSKNCNSQFQISSFNWNCQVF